VLTTGGAITAALRFLVNVGSDAYLYDVQERARAEFLLRKRGAYLWTLAPHWFRLGDDTVTLDADNGFGTMPADFGSFGEQGQVYLNGQQLQYLQPDQLLGLVATSGATGVPIHYTLHTRANGRSIIYVYPVNTAQTVLLLRGYKKRVPDFIDYPVATPTVAVGTAGLLTGAYTYRVTFGAQAGIGLPESEVGTVSASVSPSTEKVELTDIPVAVNQNVTARNLYRTEAGGEQHKFLVSILDNVTTTYSDNIEDGDLGPDAPTGLNAITGMEQFPEDFHEMLIVEALAADLNPEKAFDWDRWEKKARRLWSDQKQGQNVVQVMPRYGQGSGGGFSRSRLRSVIG